MDQGLNDRYYARDDTTGTYWPVEFNFENTCWCEVKYNAGTEDFEVFQIARS
jgi:hypothetical protein